MRAVAVAIHVGQAWSLRIIENVDGPAALQQAMEELLFGHQ